MVVLTADQVEFSFGDQPILTKASLIVGHNERIGMVGVNGSGKTTFLNCISGKLWPSAGSITIPRGVRVGHLEQLPAHSFDVPLWDVVMGSFEKILNQRRALRQLEQHLTEGGADLEKVLDQYAIISHDYEIAGGYLCEATARRILFGLGFSEDKFSQPWGSFSGGEKTRINLGCLLAQEPQLLLLDEPTNNLDVGAVQWLEDYLISYSGAMLVVSHDRMFLDRVANRIVELDEGCLKSYPGNYSSYVRLKKSHQLAQQRAYDKQQIQIQKTQQYILRYRAGIKSKQARGRLSQLNRLQRIKKIEKTKVIRPGSIKIDQESVKEVLVLSDVSKCYSGRQILDSINIAVYKGDKLALVGPNGAGKTTLLKIIVGEEAADEGQVSLGQRVKIAYFSQQMLNLNPDATVLEELMQDGNLKIQEARQYLGRILFTEADVFKKICHLSGGEQIRLALLKIIVSGANFLILDEPTNHIDISSSEAIEEVLAEFAGTLLIVSHDRYFFFFFLDGVLALENKKVVFYPGDYAHYLEQCRNIPKPEQQTTSSRKENRKTMRLAEKERQKTMALQRAELKDLERDIGELEHRRKELGTVLASPDTYQDGDEARRYTLEFQRVEDLLKEAYNRWAKLAELVDESVTGSI